MSVEWWTGLRTFIRRGLWLPTVGVYDGKCFGQGSRLVLIIFVLMEGGGCVVARSCC